MSFAHRLQYNADPCAPEEEREDISPREMEQLRQDETYEHLAEVRWIAEELEDELRTDDRALDSGAYGLLFDALAERDAPLHAMVDQYVDAWLADHRVEDEASDRPEVRTDGGQPAGAIDRDFDAMQRDYEDQVADALADVKTVIDTGDIVIDLVTRQPMYVRRRVANTLGEYYEDEEFDLATYKAHPYLPVRAADAVFECVFLGGIDDLHTSRKTYAYPRGRLARVPVEQAWTDGDVGDL
jgi:hypothetical protein